MLVVKAWGKDMRGQMPVLATLIREYVPIPSSKYGLPLTQSLVVLYIMRLLHVSFLPITA